jgi:DNA polymerase I
LAKIEPEFRGNMKEWTRLLQCPVPKLRRVAVDIEVRPSVQNRLPNADEAQEPITAVGFSASDGFRRILVLNDTGHEVETPVCLGAEVKVYTDEREMVRETFQILDEYPVVLTFNGDDFDFRFMRNGQRTSASPTPRTSPRA